MSSYVIDPPDGRIPALTPAAQAAAKQRQQAQAARRKQLNGIEAEWTTDRSNYDRCISTGVLNSITPKIYNSGSRIVQGPGWLAFQNEMIHETRVIPTDGRKQVGGGQELDGHVGRPLGGRRAGGRDPQHQARIADQRPALVGRGRADRTVYAGGREHARLPHDVNDPKVYAAPWTLRLPIPREESYGYYEYGCHEGNYAMPNLLAGSRAEEKRRAEAVARGEKIPEYVEPARGGGAGRRRCRRWWPRRRSRELARAASSFVRRRLGTAPWTISLHRPDKLGYRAPDRRPPTWRRYGAQSLAGPGVHVADGGYAGAA